MEEGTRVFLKGDTYPHRNAIKAIGGHWEPNRKLWWVGKAKRADATALVEKLNATPKPAARPATKATPKPRPEPRKLTNEQIDALLKEAGRQRIQDKAAITLTRRGNKHGYDAGEIVRLQSGVYLVVEDARSEYLSQDDAEDMMSVCGGYHRAGWVAHASAIPVTETIIEVEAREAREKKEAEAKKEEERITNLRDLIVEKGTHTPTSRGAVGRDESELAPIPENPGEVAERLSITRKSGERLIVDSEIIVYAGGLHVMTLYNYDDAPTVMWARNIQTN